MTKENGEEKTQIEYEYDTIGRVVEEKENGREKQYAYDAFGNEEEISANAAAGAGSADSAAVAIDTNPFRYCGEYVDVETGQVYLRARMYEPRTGRFTSEDTHWGPHNMIYGADGTPDITSVRQSGNLYAYCVNNPTNLLDPSGREMVMLRYAVERMGGTVQWRVAGNYEEYTITMMSGSGYFKTITLTNLMKKNGRAVITAEDLGSYFGMDYRNFIPKDGDEFYSVDDAALAWALHYGPESSHAGVEYGGAIYQTGSGKYAYVTSTDWSSEYVTIPTDQVPDGSLRGTIHTHVGWGSNENFSTKSGAYTERADEKMVERTRVPAYLLTATGRLRKVNSQFEYQPDVTTGISRI